MFCSNCGKKMIEGAKFCKDCGTAVAAGNSGRAQTGESPKTQKMVQQPELSEEQNDMIRYCSNKYSVADLHKMCKDTGLSDYEGLRKKDLIILLLKNDYQFERYQYQQEYDDEYDDEFVEPWWKRNRPTITGFAVGVVSLVGILFMNGVFDSGSSSSSGGSKTRTETQAKTETRSASYDAAGWNFMRNRLRSPSTAQLVSYVSKSDMKKTFAEMKIGLGGDCISAEMYTFDAQNAFGGTLRETHIVFFKNGRPCHSENADNISQATGHMVQVALSINGCGCD